MQFKDYLAECMTDTDCYLYVWYRMRSALEYYRDGIISEEIQIEFDIDYFNDDLLLLELECSEDDFKTKMDGFASQKYAKDNKNYYHEFEERMDQNACY